MLCPIRFVPTPRARSRPCRRRNGTPRSSSSCSPASTTISPRRYEQAINVWTRALFLDRSHARARAYIERARSALAERQRESEELLQSGLAAFGRGEGGTARRLLQTAIEQGAPSDEALAVLGRLDRLEQGAVPAADDPPRPAGAADVTGRAAEHRAAVARRLVARVAVGVAIVVAGRLVVARRGRWQWPPLLGLSPGERPPLGRAAVRRDRAGAAAPRRDGARARARAWPRAAGCTTRSSRSSGSADRPRARRRRPAARRRPEAAAGARRARPARRRPNRGRPRHHEVSQVRLSRVRSTSTAAAIAATTSRSRPRRPCPNSDLRSDATATCSRSTTWRSSTARSRAADDAEPAESGREPLRSQGRDLAPDLPALRSAAADDVPLITPAVTAAAAAVRAPRDPGAPRPRATEPAPCRQSIDADARPRAAPDVHRRRRSSQLSNGRPAGIDRDPSRPRRDARGRRRRLARCWRSSSIC